ncbi:ABC transporter permease subunit [Halorientalis pallida]|uniref:ABC transporter permease subunit n=1 Tax=Halorientalis pallida TaxID=2479928 RepID=UPI003C6FDF08
MRDHQLAVMARKDFDDAVRSKAVWVVSALFALIAILATYRISQLNFPDGVPAGVVPKLVLVTLTNPITWIVPIIALVVGYMSVVGERRSGSLKLLLGLPFERAEIFVGKILGRTAVIGVSIAVGFLAMIVTIPVLVGLGAPGEFFVAILGLFVVTLLLGAVFTTLAVSVSALANTRRQAITTVFALFFVTHVAWTGVIQFLALPFGGVPRGGSGGWYLLLSYLSPTAAYTRVASLVFTNFPVPYPGIAMDGIGQRARIVESLQPTPFYLTEWFAILTLLAWAVGAGLLAHAVFRNADLG